MADFDSDQPPRPGRRALPADDGGKSSLPSSDLPRRSIQPLEAPKLDAAPRRVVPSNSEDSSPRHLWEERRRLVWIGVPVVVLLGFVMWNWLRPPPEVTVVVPPSVVATTSTSLPTTPSTSPSVVEPSTPPASEPGSSVAPLPGTVSPTPIPSASQEPTPNGSIASGAVVLNDATFMAPEGWTLYGDELIEDGRRAVRLSDADTDARLQAVTLIPGDSDLTSSCGSLVDLQQAQFTDVTRQLVVPIGVDTTTGNGVRCGFVGVRSSDAVANTVTFTLVRRSSDAHVLMLRATVPEGTASDALAVRQLGAMSCEASSSFGVALPLC